MGGGGIASKMLQEEKEEIRQLLAEMRGGSEDAAWKLVERYGPHIRRAVRGRMSRQMRSAFDSDDFVQSVWVAIIGMGQPIHELEASELIGLLAAIARNKVIGQARRKKNKSSHQDRVTYDDSDVRAKTPTTASPSACIIAREQWERIVSRLPPRSQDILRLRVSGMTYVEIATEANCSVRTVQRIVQGAIKAIEK